MRSVLLYQNSSNYCTLLTCSIPEVVGDALGYEVTGNVTKMNITTTFYDVLTQHHSYATGGSTDGEMWGDADLLGNYINDRTEESCTTYNVLKVKSSTA